MTLLCPVNIKRCFYIVGVGLGWFKESSLFVHFFFFFKIRNGKTKETMKKKKIKT